MAAGTERRARRVLAIGLLVLAGCGRFTDESGPSRAVLEEQPGGSAPASDVVEDEPPAGTATVSAPTSTAPPIEPPEAAPSGTVGAGTVDPSPRNAAAATTDGLEVQVVAEHGPEYGAAPRFRIQVTLTNRSERTRYHFLGQGNFAAIVDATGTPVWTSTDCNPTMDVYEIYGGAAPVEPGEAVTVIVDYPERGAGDGCHLGTGGYTLYGLFPVCPDDEVRETENPGTYSCPEETVVQYASAGLPISIG